MTIFYTVSDYFTPHYRKQITSLTKHWVMELRSDHSPVFTHLNLHQQLLHSLPRQLTPGILQLYLLLNLLAVMSNVNTSLLILHHTAQLYAQQQTNIIN